MLFPPFSAWKLPIYPLGPTSDILSLMKFCFTSPGNITYLFLWAVVELLVCFSFIAIFLLSVVS